MTRSMFLSINEIFREKSLIGADQIRLAEWCRTRATVPQHEALAKIVKNKLIGFSIGKINAAKPNADASD